MSLNPKLLPPNLVRCMTPEEQRKLGYMSAEKAKAKRDAKLEKELHEQVASLLRLRGVLFVLHCRMDRRTTVRVGTPDFLFAYPARSGGLKHDVPCAIELKRPGEEPTQEQLQCHMEMHSDGWRVLVADNLEAVRDWLDSL